MMAALAPEAGATVALPTAIKTSAALPPATEIPELLALSAELDGRLEAYRLSAARLAKARAVATELWPAVPAELVVTGRADRDFYECCYEREIDVEGNEVWPEPYQVDGKWFGHFPREILQSGSLRQVLSELHAEPEGFEAGVEVRLIQQIDAAEAYEEARYHAIETSGIEEAKQDAERCAGDLCTIARRLCDHPPQTAAGVLTHARALAAYVDAQRDGFAKAPGEAVTILGRSLADTVLRIGMAAQTRAGRRPRPPPSSNRNETSDRPHRTEVPHGPAQAASTTLPADRRLAGRDAR
ncbi:hypothetical protein [Nitrobacter sp.]|uniref:hypothetical protein n=1 Tax=Nitrobacter sp. TaxID=29420 RepID=UPI0029CABC24|nr:hypothetical protein [Nitrobacter sp.]